VPPGLLKTEYDMYALNVFDWVENAIKENRKMIITLFIGL
jgi:hypothetical protein